MDYIKSLFPDIFSEGVWFNIINVYHLASPRSDYHHDCRCRSTSMKGIVTSDICEFYLPATPFFNGGYL